MKAENDMMSPATSETAIGIGYRSEGNGFRFRCQHWVTLTLLYDTVCSGDIELGHQPKDSVLLGEDKKQDEDRELVFD